MPTGYTSRLHDGEQTFEEFLWTCARGMGAFVTMRDAPLDAPLPDEFGPQTSYLERSLAQALATSAEASAWTEEQARAAALATYTEAHEAYLVSSRELQDIRLRYQRMLSRVEAW